MKKFFMPTIVVVLFLLTGCNTAPPAAVVEAEVETAIPVSPTATPTPIPPTATPKPIAPTATPTPKPQTEISTVEDASNEFIASQVEDIVGIWETQFIGDVAYMQYEADGASKLTSSLENLEEGIIGIPGTFWFEDNVLHVADNYGEGTYEVKVHKEGDTPVHLDFVEIDDPNSDRAADLTAGMTWVAPSLRAEKMEEGSPAISTEQYLIYLPEEYEEQQEPWPLLLFLHGGGGDGPPPNELIEQGQSFSFIIVAPQMAIPNWSGEVVDRVLNDVTAQYRVDEDRIYVTGLSVGGFGTWTVALAYPERFAAIAPVAGGGDPELVDESIKHLPVWVFHGAKDDIIPLDRAQEMVDALEEVGGNVTFTIYPEAEHDAWTETYKNPELYEWFLAQMLVTSAGASAFAPEPTVTPEPPKKILFVGNSLSYWNAGLDLHMEQLASSANPPLDIEADKVIKLGATLETIYEFTKARKSINEGDYDVVVLQEDIPETDVDTFHEYARKFDAEVKETGAKPVLFMAWSYEQLGWITMEEIAQAHRDIAAELGVDVAPVGLAWQCAMEERPELDMYDSDKVHPSIYGTYLAVNVVYATVYDKNPAGLAYLPSGITEEEATFLQRIAWETVQENKAQQ